MQSAFLGEEDRADFEELIDKLDEAAKAINNVVDADSVVNSLF